MYFPKNKIITDLYSNGQLMYKSSKQPYYGPYFKLYNGLIFSGKNQFDKPNEELVNTSQTEDPPEGEDFYSPDLRTSSVDNYNYSLMKGKVNTPLPIPVPDSFETPNEKDYKLGMFTRYFILKINDSRAIKEINKETFDLIKQEDPKYNWEYYIPFKLYWELKGDIVKVYNTNKNITELTESRLKKYEISKFLKFDYIKYYKFTPQDNLNTMGGELIYSNGTEYKGPYHIDENLGYMDGSSKNDSKGKKLILKSLYIR